MSSSAGRLHAARRWPRSALAAACVALAAGLRRAELPASRAPATLFVTAAVGLVLVAAVPHQHSRYDTPGSSPPCTGWRVAGCSSVTAAGRVAGRPAGAAGAAVAGLRRAALAWAAGIAGVVSVFFMLESCSDRYRGFTVISLPRRGAACSLCSGDGGTGDDGPGDPARDRARPQPAWRSRRSAQAARCRMISMISELAGPGLAIAFALLGAVLLRRRRGAAAPRRQRRFPPRRGRPARQGAVAARPARRSPAAPAGCSGWRSPAAAPPCTRMALVLAPAVGRAAARRAGRPDRRAAHRAAHPTAGPRRAWSWGCCSASPASRCSSAPRPAPPSARPHPTVPRLIASLVVAARRARARRAGPRPLRLGALRRLRHGGRRRRSAWSRRWCGRSRSPSPPVTSAPLDSRGAHRRGRPRGRPAGRRLAGAAGVRVRAARGGHRLPDRRRPDRRRPARRAVLLGEGAATPVETWLPAGRCRGHRHRGRRRAGPPPPRRGGRASRRLGPEPQHSRCRPRRPRHPPPDAQSRPADPVHRR